MLHSPLVVNRNIFPKVFLKRLQDIYLQQLRYSDSSKVNYYMESCHEGIGYTFQNYIEKVGNPNYRKVLVKLRSGTNCLFLEKGRYENIPHRIESAPYVKTKLKIMSIFSLDAVNYNLREINGSEIFTSRSKI